MNDITLVEAVNQALGYALANDPNVILFGEDIATNGGVFRATEGLHQRFPERVLDTPLAESMIAGTAIGMGSSTCAPMIGVTRGVAIGSTLKPAGKAVDIKGVPWGRTGMAMGSASTWTPYA